MLPFVVRANNMHLCTLFTRMKRPFTNGATIVPRNGSTQQNTVRQLVTTKEPPPAL